MIDNRNEELAALYALDLLEGAEKTGFEAALARDPELRRHVEGLRAAAADLARLAPLAEPPPELKARILSSLGSRPALRAVAAAPSAHRAPLLPFSRVLIPWAIAASLAVATLWSARTAWTFRSENAVIREQQQLADLNLRSLRNGMEAERIVRQQQLADAQRALADASRQENESRQQLAQLRQDADAAQQKFAEATRQASEAGRQIAQLTQKLKKEGDLAQFKIATLASMLGNSPQALAVVVWNPMEQEGMIKLAKLDMPAAGMDYQLWLIGPDGKPISGGVVTMNPATGEAHTMFTATQQVNTVAKFAISLEQKGGMPEPHGKIVMTIE
jgi:anti-sigma-K factor RskA